MLLAKVTVQQTVSLFGPTAFKGALGLLVLISRYFCFSYVGKDFSISGLRRWPKINPDSPLNKVTKKNFQFQLSPNDIVREAINTLATH